MHKIFWIAISAPVIIAAAAGGSPRPPEALPIGKAGWNLEQLLPIRPAYGNEAIAAEINPNQPKSPSAESSPFLQGLNLFLGGSRDPYRYRVVVHSVENDKAKAELVAKRLNEKFSLPATAVVGERKPNNPYWPVVINGWTTYAEAKKLKDSIAGMDFGFDADNGTYISVKDR